MSGPRRTLTPIFIAALLVATPRLLYGLDLRAHAVEQAQAATVDEVARAIRLYEQGDSLAAAETLRRSVKLHKDNPSAWLYLGLALNRVGQIKEARKAFETAVKLNPNSSEAHTGWAYTLLLANKMGEAVREAESALALNAKNAVAHYIIGVVRLRTNEPANALREAEESLHDDPNFSASLLLKCQALLGLYVVEFFSSEQPSLAGNVTPAARKHSRLKEAYESLEKYLQANRQARDLKLWRDQLEALRPYAENADKPASERTVFAPGEVTTKARILFKPQPGYTIQARGAGIAGTVVLRAILAADGTVQNILLLRSLSHGLSEEAISAARKIKFTPATKDGRPVSQFIQIEYSFNFY
ncbi:MAG TPA: TonB family protein [Pyrinomonadaceae bacterium]|jgi:TonB family protein